MIVGDNMQPLPADTQVFTIHRDSDFTPLLGVVIGLTLVEAAGVNLILQRWNPIALASSAVQR